MNNNEIINKLSIELKNVQFLIDNIYKHENISQIDLDLILNKVRNLYEDILKIKFQTDNTLLNKVIFEEKDINEKTKNEFKKIIEEKIIEEEISVFKESETDKKDILIKEQVLQEEVITQDIINAPVTELNKVSEEEPLIEINEDYKESAIKPDIKQASLFGDNNGVKQTEPIIKFPEKKESISEKLQKSQLSVNDVLSNQIKDTNIASQLQHIPITNIRSVISINDRIWFVKELFDNNNDKYNKVVDKINNLSTYNEAIDYLSSIFNMTQEKESLNKFFEIVQRRFLNK